MKQILIVSGKGGTGKTSITASLASYFESLVLVDCDVDASDLYLILKPEVQQTFDFISGHTAHILQKDCTQCSMCLNVCKFDAVKVGNKGTLCIDAIDCEGCGVCIWMCPQKAIEFPESLCGQWFFSNTRHGPMVHAKLAIGAENSGKLVSEIRGYATKIAKNQKKDIILIDGPPGIGCPVIASLTGVDCVVVVTEPTLSAIHDMERIIALAKHFGISTYVCINKSDINEELTQTIKKRIKVLDVELVGEIPYDTAFTRAQVQKKSIVEYSNGKTTQCIEELAQKLMSKII
ncbi:MAG: ATP-binding protein [Clostridiales bacterium]|nr:ATP-binding protein [Clostridiales bacterium]